VIILFLQISLDRVSAEELFIELAVNNVDTVAADRLAIITGLDVNTLYEVATARSSALRIFTHI
jgi:hypothetical protein